MRSILLILAGQWVATLTGCASFVRISSEKLFEAEWNDTGGTLSDRATFTALCKGVKVESSIPTVEPGGLTMRVYPPIEQIGVWECRYHPVWVVHVDGRWVTHEELQTGKRE
jgi:hypothetical protein